MVALRANDPTLPVGDRPFAIYQWQMRGLREDAMLVPVVEDPAVAAAFMDIFTAAADASDVAPPDGATIEGLESWHHERWTRRRATHVAEAAEIARFRRDSLEASHRARVAILEEQLAAASEDRIRRMRAGQLAPANADRQEALEGLAAAERRAHILPRRVASGTLRGSTDVGTPFHDWLDNPYAKRQRWVSASHENNFDRGIWNATVDKYAEQTGFGFASNRPGSCLNMMAGRLIATISRALPE